MKLLNNLPLLWKCLIGPLIAAICFVAYLGFNFSTASSNSQRLSSVNDVLFPTLELATQDVHFLEGITDVLNNAAASGEKDLLGDADELARKVNANLERVETLNGKGGEHTMLTAEFNDYYSRARALSSQMLAGTAPDQAAIAEMTKALSAYRAHLEAFEKSSKARFGQTLLDADKASDRALFAGVAAAVIALGASLSIGFIVAFSLKRNVDEVVSSLKDIAQGQGDLRQRIAVTSSDEVGALVHWFNTFIEKLHGDVSRMVASINELGNSTREMGVIVQDTSSAISQEKSIIEDVTSQVASMNARIDDVASSASSASTAAGEADRSAEQGLRYVRDTVGRISELAQSVDQAASTLIRLEDGSQQINRVVDVIKEISDQINLLALNAAIEAARAGEHGRGFAVVADEVRKMAVRTQDSTGEIFEIVRKLQATTQSVVEVIQASQREAEVTVEDIQHSRGTLEAITDKVGTISAMNQTIADATNDQLSASARVDDRISALNNISNSTYEQSARLARISERIHTLTEDIRSVAGHFKT